MDNITNIISQTSGGLFSIDNFIPREVCMGRDKLTLIFYIIGSLSVFLAYFFIPLILLHFRSVLKPLLPKLIGVPFLLASLFILSCGAGHLIDIILVKYPVYRFSALWTCFTGVCSWAFFLYVVKYLKIFNVINGDEKKNDEINSEIKEGNKEEK